MRSPLAMLAGAATAALGAMIVGEYELVGLGALLAGAAFGFVVAEVIGAIDRSPPMWVVAGAPVLVAGGLWWARAIQWRVTIDQGAAVPVEVTAAVVVGASVAATALSRKRRRRTPERR